MINFHYFDYFYILIKSLFCFIKKEYSILKIKEGVLNKNKSEDVNIENKSMFNILEKIKILTSSSYDSFKVQQTIENEWTVLIKDKYRDNVYKTIEYLYPKIY